MSHEYTTTPGRVLWNNSSGATVNQGTLYKVINWTPLGLTKGYRRHPIGDMLILIRYGQLCGAPSSNRWIAFMRRNALPSGPQSIACSSSSSVQVSGLGSWCGREIRQFLLIQTVVLVFCQGFGNYFWQWV